MASEHFDAVVLATGAWLGKLARRFGVRAVVQAGRGYSFCVPSTACPDGPVYFPAAARRLHAASATAFASPG